LLRWSQVKAGPRDGDDWIKRMKEEYTALIAYQKFNKEAGNEWFTIESNKTGTRWTGKVWTYHEQLRYEFDLEFDLPVRGLGWGEAWTLGCLRRGSEEGRNRLGRRRRNSGASTSMVLRRGSIRHPCWTIPHSLLTRSLALRHRPAPQVAYPGTPPELALPELDGKTEKMYRGGKICLDSHFRPLWARNVPHFGIAHAMALGMGPWLAVEIPSLVALGRIKHADDAK
jgi:hypothetical protein